MTLYHTFHEGAVTYAMIDNLPYQVKIVAINNYGHTYEVIKLDGDKNETFIVPKILVFSTLAETKHFMKQSLLLGVNFPVYDRSKNIADIDIDVPLRIKNIFTYVDELFKKFD